MDQDQSKGKATRKQRSKAENSARLAPEVETGKIRLGRNANLCYLVWRRLSTRDHPLFNKYGRNRLLFNECGRERAAPYGWALLAWFGSFDNCVQQAWKARDKLERRCGCRWCTLIGWFIIRILCGTAIAKCVRDWDGFFALTLVGAVWWWLSHCERWTVRWTWCNALTLTRQLLILAALVKLKILYDIAQTQH